MMPRFVQFPEGYDITPRECDDDDGLDAVRAIVCGVFVCTVGAGILIGLHFLWGAA